MPIDDDTLFTPYVRTSEIMKSLTQRNLKKPIKVKPKVAPVPTPPVRPDTVLSLGQKLKSIDTAIQQEKDPGRLVRLQSDFYKLSKKIDSESERILTKNYSEERRAHRSRLKKHIK